MKTRRCSTCKRRPARKRQRTCGPCHSLYMQDWRAAKKQENDANMAELSRLREATRSPIRAASQQEKSR